MLHRANKSEAYGQTRLARVYQRCALKSSHIVQSPSTMSSREEIFLL